MICGTDNGHVVTLDTDMSVSADITPHVKLVMTPQSPIVPGGLFVAGTNLTENTSYVLSHPSGSVEKMTLQALPALTDWVCAQLPGQESSCTNIIAGDFVGASSFVSEVIALNRKLLPP